MTTLAGRTHRFRNEAAKCRRDLSFGTVVSSGAVLLRSTFRRTSPYPSPAHKFHWCRRLWWIVSGFNAPPTASRAVGLFQL